MNGSKNSETLREQKKKILCIVQLPPPIHGASIMNDNLVNGEIVNTYFELIVINLQFLRSLDDISKFSFRKFFKSFRIGFEIISQILTKKPDLVYLTFAIKGFALYRDLGYAFLAKILGRKVVFHLHEKGIKATVKRSRFKKLLFRKAFMNESIICISGKLVSEIEDVCKAAPFIVPNGIRFYKPLKEKAESESEHIPQILFLSNYMESKGILNLIDALEIIQKQGYTFNATLVGGPIDFTVEYLRNLLSEKNLTSSTRITGPLYHNEKIAELQNADIFVLPTKNEAFPLVILEAMQFGLPVISTPEGGIPEMVIDGETGLLVDPQDTHELAEKIAELLDNADLSINMGKKGLERFKNYFTIDIFERNMTSTFDKILNYNKKNV